jgi:hypothetical protein
MSDLIWSCCDVGLCLIISNFMVLIFVDKLWIGDSSLLLDIGSELFPVLD